MTQVIELCSAAHRVRVGPENGGRLLAFYTETAQGNWHWLRPAQSDDADPRGSACYPLLPFSNRIENAEFPWQGETIRLPKNFLPEPHAIHGVGWQCDWQSVNQHENSVELTLSFAADGAWPWSFSARQGFVLEAEGLFMDLSIRNESDQPMPCGLGVHPYFHGPDGTLLRLYADAVLEKAPEDGLPVTANSTHPALADFARAALLPRGLDTGLEGWEGAARIDWPDHGKWLQLQAPGFSKAVYFSPTGEEYFCLEPVTHTTNALNRLPEGVTEGGVKILAPGECMAMEMRLTVGEG